jgi:hypothetical protein
MVDLCLATKCPTDPREPGRLANTGDMESQIYDPNDEDLLD